MLRIKEIHNITTVRQNLPGILDELESDIIITRNYRPQAIIKPLQDDTDERPALIILGTKAESEKKAEKTISEINSNAELFSRIIFVCSDKTRKYGFKLKGCDIRLVINEKTEYPIISPLKDGLGGLNPGDNFFIFTFLSAPEATTRLPLICEAVKNCRDEKKLVAMLTLNGDPTHPIALSCSLQDEIIKTRKELGIPYLIRKYEDNIVYKEIN